MNRKLQIVVAASTVILALPAWAGYDGHRHAGHGYDNDRYHYAKVIRAEPVFEVIRVPGRRHACEDRVVRRRVAEHRSAGPVIFGAILGGVIGNQLSRGHGHHGDRSIATIAGAAIGGVVGSEIQHRKYPARYYTGRAPVCRTHANWWNERRIVAWDVKWKYQGRVYHSRVSEQPGKRIRVRIGPAYR